MSGPPQIPGFTYVQQIGQGGFADVFLYEQEWPRQRVAIKVVRPDVPLTEREKAMFTTEADAMARLSDHPYIVSVVTAGTTIAPPGREPQRMRPRDAYVLEPGTVLDLAQVYAVRFETGAVAR